MSANYTSSEDDLVYAFPDTTNNLMFILSENKNITILPEFPYTTAFSNGSYIDNVRNDTVIVSVMNSGSVNITIDSFELFNGSNWLEFNFTDLSGVLSYKNYTLEPYEIVTFHNLTINNNYTSRYIELNVTEILPVRVNSTATVVSTTRNITILNTTAHFEIRPENNTYANATENIVYITLTNYGPTNLILNYIQINETIFSKSSDKINDTLWYDLSTEFLTMTPGQTKTFWVLYSTSQGEYIEITIKTTPLLTDIEGIYAYNF